MSICVCDTIPFHWIKKEEGKENEKKKKKFYKIRVKDKR
jgi:hypothetical protein